METFIKLIEPLLYVAVVCFPLTTAIMIFSLKRLGYDPVGSSVKSKWSIDIDLSFFSKLRKGYAQERGNKFIPALNCFSFYFGILGLIGVQLLLVISELW